MQLMIFNLKHEICGCAWGGHTHTCICSSVGLTYLHNICTCVPSFRLDIFPTNFLSVANGVNELIEVFNGRR